MLRPRVAVFDCDGTLWTNDSGMDFFYWTMDQGLVPPGIARVYRSRYADYKRGRVDEVTMCGEMARMYAELHVWDLEVAVNRFFPEVVRPNYFDDMQELCGQLSGQDCELWAISSTVECVVREGARDFNIPAKRVIGAQTAIENDVITSRLLRVPSGPHKAEMIREKIGAKVDAVFGNSIHDLNMMDLAGQAFAINPNPDLEQVAEEREWVTYWPERVRTAR
ncbi:MAG: haloacid dehalogenase-like hydrolase [Acidobacteriales bacterium]|nr:haloacid dehalogenase-like hydrolase [Terriglobales bacterium]